MAIRVVASASMVESLRFNALDESSNELYIICWLVGMSVRILYCVVTEVDYS